MHPEETYINDYVDGALDASGRTAIERHLESCDSCRALVADLREIARVAATLRDPDGDRVLPVRAWTRIERAISLEPRVTRRAERGWRGRAWLAGLAVAAALVLATAAGLRFGSFGHFGTPTAPAAPSGAGASVATAAPGGATDSLETEMRQAEQHYEKAIKGLEQITVADRGALDARTAATLQSNLAVIDQAIGESRAAVRSQPASEPAQQSLIENFKAKVALLQDTVALINEMRKGNEAGAARIVSDLKPKGD